MVDAPVENNRETANIKLIKGIDILTAAKANSPTPLLTNIPSTIVYSEKTHIATTDGARYLKNLLPRLMFSFIDILYPFIITPVNLL